MLRSQCGLRSLFLGLIFMFGAGSCLAADEPAPAAPSQGAQEKPDYLAIIDGQKIPIGDYVSALRRGMKQRFYHGNVPDEERRKYFKEVADEMIERFLLIREAKRRGIEPDMPAVEAALARYEEQFKDNQEWAKVRADILPKIREKLIGDSLAMRLEEQVKSIDKPSESELRQFYEEHKDLFTTPERIKVSLILLRVDPAASAEVWQQAHKEAASIVERLNKGADFAELARIHSSDKSAKDGGDMGYVHSGMLGANAQKVLDIMEPGEISAPVVMLEGVSIFRLDDRIKAQLNPLEAVRERAEKLYLREKGNEAWDALRKDLRAKAKIVVNDLPWRPSEKAKAGVVEK